MKWNVVLLFLFLGCNLPVFSQIEPGGEEREPVDMVNELILTPFAIVPNSTFYIDVFDKPIARIKRRRLVQIPISIFWKEVNRLSLDINEVSFQNWSAGGNNSVSSLMTTEIRRNYRKANVRWNNELITRYGINVQKGEALRKTDDQLELNSTVGFRYDPISNWYHTAKVNFKTQFTQGYNYPDRENPISAFMAPGYLFSGIGAEYGKDSDNFSVYISPATQKTTFVLDQRMADRGDFGVQAAEYDANGVMYKQGKRTKSELGFLVTNAYNVKLLKNILMEHRVSFYTDYLNNFGNIDVDWDISFSIRINQYVMAKFRSHLKYDDDVKNIQELDNGLQIERGARVQWKQQLGFGMILDI